MSQYIKKFQDGGAVTPTFDVGNAKIDLKNYEDALMQNYQEFKDWYTQQGHKEKDIAALDDQYSRYMNDLKSGNIHGVGLDNKFTINDKTKSQLDLSKDNLGPMGYFAAKVANNQAAHLVKPADAKKTDFTSDILEEGFNKSLFGGSSAPDWKSWYDRDALDPKTKARGVKQRLTALSQYLDSFDPSKYQDKDNTYGGMDSITAKLQDAKDAVHHSMQTGVIDNNTYAAMSSLGFNIRPYMSTNPKLAFDENGNVTDDATKPAAPKISSVENGNVTDDATKPAAPKISSVDKTMLGVQTPSDYSGLYNRAASFVTRWQHANVPEFTLDLRHSYRKSTGHDVLVDKQLILRGQTPQQALGIIKNNITQIGQYLNKYGINALKMASVVAPINGEKMKYDTWMERYLRQLKLHPKELGASGYRLENNHLAYSIPGTYNNTSGTIYVYDPESDIVKRLRVDKHQSILRSTWDTYYPGLNDYIDAMRQQYDQASAPQDENPSVDEDSVPSQKNGGIIKAQYGARIDTGEGSSLQDFYNKYSPQAKRTNAIAQAKQEGYSSDAAAKHATENVNMDASDWLHVAALAGDIVSLGGTYADIGGTAVSTLADIGGDIADHRSAWDITKNAAANIGWGVAGLVTGAKSGKVVRRLMQFGPKLFALYAAHSTFTDPAVKRSAEKIFLHGDIEHATHQDLYNCIQIARTIVGLGNVARATGRNYVIHKAQSKGGNVFKVQTSAGKDVYLSKESLEKINAAGKANGQEAANKIFREQAKANSEGTEAHTFADDEGLMSTFDKTGFHITPRKVSAQKQFVYDPNNKYAEYIKSYNEKYHLTHNGRASRYEREMGDTPMPFRSDQVASKILTMPWLHSPSLDFLGIKGATQRNREFVNAHSPHEETHTHTEETTAEPTSTAEPTTNPEPTVAPEPNTGSRVATNEITNSFNGVSNTSRQKDLRTIAALKDLEPVAYNSLKSAEGGEDFIKNVEFVQANRTSKDAETQKEVLQSLKDVYAHVNKTNFVFDAKNQALSHLQNSAAKAMASAKSASARNGGRLNFVLELHKQGGLLKFQAGGSTYNNVVLNTDGYNGTWNSDVFSNDGYQNAILEGLKTKGDDYMGFLNGMQHDHSQIRVPIGNTVQRNDAVKNYQNNYRGIRDSVHPYSGLATTNFNRLGVELAAAKNRYHTLSHMPTSGDWKKGKEDSADDYTPEGLFGELTDDRRLLGRRLTGQKDDFTPEQLNAWNEKLHSVGYEQYYDPSDQYYKIRKQTKPQEQSIAAGSTPEQVQKPKINVPVGDLMGLGRLIGDLQSTNDRTREYLSHLHPTILNPFSTYVQHQGRYDIKNEANNTGSQMTTRAKMNISSDAAMNNAAMLEAQGQANELRAKGSLADNEASAATDQESQKAAWGNVERANTIANTNADSFNKNEQLKAGIKAQSQTANQQSIDNYLMGLEKDQKDREKERKELQDQIDFQAAGSPTYDPTFDPVYIKFKSDYTAETDPVKQQALVDNYSAYKKKKDEEAKAKYLQGIAKLKGLRYNPAPTDYTVTRTVSSKNGGKLYDNSNNVTKASIADNNRLIKSILDLVKEQNKSARNLKLPVLKVIKTK